MTEQAERAEPFVGVTQEESPMLWALQQYQKVIRRWAGALSVIEFAVLMQILDRTVGWQRTRRTISMRDLLQGGRLYRGIGHAVGEASVWAAVRRLEALGIIARRPSNLHHRMKEYVINLEWQEPPRMEEVVPEIWELEDDGEWVPSLYEMQDQSSTS